MALNLLTIIANVRSELNDTATSHLSRQETPLGLIDGGNKVYMLAYYPLVDSASATVTVDGVVLSSGYSFDLAKGRLTLTVAPITSVLVDYYFYAFTDTDITVWINNAVQTCSYTALTGVPDPMGAAVERLAISMGCQAWARKWAEGFSWQVGPESVDKKAISANYLSLAKQKWDEGIAVRNDNWTRYGQREAPAGQFLQFNIPRYDVLR